jgi:TRAP-type C4-dicarboxylate transport system permease small subunit
VIDVTLLFNAVCSYVEFAVRMTCVAILATIVVMNGAEIILRSFFSYSLSWIYETNILLASWMYFLGIVLVYHRQGDITVIGVVDLLPVGARRVYSALLQALTAGGFFLLAWFTWKLIQLQWPFKTPGVGFPRVSFTLPLMISSVALTLEAVRRIIAPAKPSLEEVA